MLRLRTNVGVRRVGIVAFGACVAALGAGCSRGEIDRAGDTLASAAPIVASDAFIIAQIESKFVRIDGDSALHVAVASHDGVVRVTGKTKSQAISERYARAVKSVAGVKGETLALTVDPKLPSTGKRVADLALAASVRANLIGQTGFNAIGLGVGAAGGTVTLSGRVRSAALRTTILTTVRATKGVTAVVDRMRVGS